ncbi:MAG TPA: amidohydrolase [Myxococcota bacterium]|nr:amidohydrolase [Myxococcota bacterium]
MSAAGRLAALALVALFIAAQVARSEPKASEVHRVVARSEPKADLVLFDASVYTVDAARSWARAVAVRDGRIAYVGDDAGARALAGPRTAIVDLGGGMLVPGFVDAHVHPISGGLQAHRCDLSDRETVEALLARISECAAARPEAPWILGGGWALPLFPGANPDRRSLDEAVPDRPAALSAADGHSLWVNSKALALAGITRATPDPPGGRIERDAAGEPSGTLRESAGQRVWDRVPPPAREESAAALRTALDLAHRFGITTWIDASAGEAELAAYRDADRAGGLGMFVRAALRVDPSRGAEQVTALAALRARNWGEHVAAGAAKLFADGVIESGTAALLAPYVGRGGSRGELLWSEAGLREIALALDAAGFQIHVHAIGDRAVRATLDAIEALDREHGPRDRRATIAHIELIDPADIPRFRRLRAVADFQPIWALEDRYIRDLTVPFLGPERARWLYPIASVAKSGAPLAAGSDWSVTSMNPLEAIEVALTRRDPASPPGPAWIPEERADLATLLAAYTIGGAWAAFREREVGSIEVGKRADLALLERNLFEIPAHEISETRVLRTWFEGREVYRAAVSPATD